VDFATLCLGLFFNGRVVLIQPGLDRFRALFVCLLDGLLWGEAPACEVFAYGAHTQLQAAFLLDELHHSGAAPQEEVHLQLLGAFVADGLLDVGFLLWREQAGVALGAPTPCGFDGWPAALLTDQAPCALPGSSSPTSAPVP
jgi:hypothetical protein